MTRSALLFLALLCLPTGAVADPVDELAREDLTPSRRAELVAQVCEASEGPSPAELAGLLTPAAPRPAQIDGARIAACRMDPALIPLMYLSFHRSKVAHLADDPDVYERLLRALQRFPIDVLRGALEDDELGLGGAVHGELSELAWARLSRDWLEPLGGEGAPTGPAADVGARVLPEASRWLADVFAMGADGLIRLQTDSGDHGFLFLQRLQGWHLAALIESGSPAHARLAVQVCLQSGMCDVAAREALSARIAREPDVDLGSPTDLPDTRDDPVELYGPLRHLTAIDLPPASGESLVLPPRRVPRALLAAAVLLALWVVWVLALRVRPRWRRALFPVGGVMLAATGITAAELALGWAGVQPLAVSSSGGWSEPVALRGVQSGAGYLLEPVTLADEPWLQIANLGARWNALPEVARHDRSSWRIVTLGESSVHASNHLAEDSFAEVLGRRLRARNPGQPVEVLNGGVGGAISDDIVAGAEDALRAGADLLVLYHGINDLGRFEILASMKAFSPLQLGVRIVLDESSLARVIHDLLPEQQPEPEEEGAWRDDEPLSPAAVSRLQRLAALRCSRNQQRIVRAARSQGVPVVLVSQALVTSHDYPDEPEKRRLLRWIAYETAARTGAPLLDGHEVMGAHSLAQGGPADPGADYFWDQLHPSRLGHAVLGEALAPTVERLLKETRGAGAR